MSSCNRNYIYDNPELLGGVKPCPFCGGETTLVSSPFDYSCQVRCTKCGAETREVENIGQNFTTYYANMIEAVELWNKRAGESE